MATKPRIPKDAVRLMEAPFVKETESDDSVVLSKFTSDDSVFVALTSFRVLVMFSPFSRISKLALPTTRTCLYMYACMYQKSMTKRKRAGEERGEKRQRGGGKKKGGEEGEDKRRGERRYNPPQQWH